MHVQGSFMKEWVSYMMVQHELLMLEKVKGFTIYKMRIKGSINSAIKE